MESQHTWGAVLNPLVVSISTTPPAPPVGHIPSPFKVLGPFRLIPSPPAKPTAKRSDKEEVREIDNLNLISCRSRGFLKYRYP